MVTVFDVPAEPLILRAASELKKRQEIKPPEWAPFVKTGRQTEKPPTQKDWWYIRTAAVLRKIYCFGPIGTERLAAEFGGAADRGDRPDAARKGSRSIIRKALQQLQAAKLIKSTERTGRRIAPEGQKLLDGVAHEVMQEAVKTNPELGKY